ncbi:hypothetical protein J6590_022702 [Homalodisca vitripennis]|nr:hypothetical protein J6590_022702 [Homalodisca vitripennis]
MAAQRASGSRSGSSVLFMPHHRTVAYESHSIGLATVEFPSCSNHLNIQPPRAALVYSDFAEQSPTRTDNSGKGGRFTVQRSSGSLSSDRGQMGQVLVWLMDCLINAPPASGNGLRNTAGNL